MSLVSSLALRLNRINPCESLAGEETGPQRSQLGRGGNGNDSRANETRDSRPGFWGRILIEQGRELLMNVSTLAVLVLMVGDCNKRVREGRGRY